MTTILLVRHGHVEGIEPRRFRGRADLPLTSRGAAEAQQLARHIASAFRPIKVYTSPLRRCVDTAEAIAGACGIQMEAIESLSDINYGEWQWKGYAEVQQSDPERFAAWFATPHLIRFPGGEALQDIVARSAEVLRHALREHPADTVVLVGHDSFNRALLLQLLDQPLSAYWRLAQDPCCVNEIEITSQSIRIVRINETKHLSRERP